MRIGLPVATALLVLSGCGAQSTSPGSLPALPSVSAGPTAAVRPAPSGATREAATQFARYFLATVNDAFRTGDPAVVRRLSAATCRACSSLVDAIVRPPAPGEVVEGGDYVVTAAASPPLVGNRTTVLLTYELTPVKVSDASGRVLRRRPAERAISATLDLQVAGGVWKVVEFANVQ